MVLKDMGWDDGLVTKELAMLAWGPELGFLAFTHAYDTYQKIILRAFNLHMEMIAKYCTKSHR